MALDLDYEGKLRCPRRGSLTPEQCRGHLRERDGEGRRANLDCQLCTVGAHVVAYLTHPSPGHRDGRGRFACPGYGALVDERTCRARRRQRGFGAGGWEFPKCRACDVGQELDPEAPADDGGEGRPKRGRPPSYPGRTSRETLRRPEAQPAELQRSAEPEPPELDVPVTRKAGVPLVETPPRKTPRPRGTTSEGAHETRARRAPR